LLAAPQMQLKLSVVKKWQKQNLPLKI